MATAEQSGLGTDLWMQIPANWEAYENLLASRGQKGRPKYTYCDGRLTIVSPGAIHERASNRIGFLIESVLTFLGLDFDALGSVTLLTKRHPRTGKEADQTY